MAGGFGKNVNSGTVPPNISATQLIVVPVAAGVKNPEREVRSGMVIVVAPLRKLAVAKTVIELDVVAVRLHEMEA